LILRGGTRRPAFVQKRSKSMDAPPKSQFKQEETEGEMTMTITYYDDNEGKGGRGLEAQVYQMDPDAKGGYKQLALAKSMQEADNGPSGPGSSSLTAYNAVASLEKSGPRLFGQQKTPRSATFVAAFRLFEGAEEGDGRVWRPKIPDSKTFYEKVGVDPLCGAATGAMWGRLFLDRRTYGVKSEPVLDLAEFNMIGRCLEKILQVDMIPVTFDDEDINEDDVTDEDYKCNRLKYSALVSNLFVKAAVDLEAML
jgi:hypothetical protein